MDEQSTARESSGRGFTAGGLFAAALVAAAVIVLYMISRFNYLLFHSLAESFAIAVSLGVFVIGWHSRRFMRNGYLAFVGIAYFYVAGVDLLHSLSYKGTGIFPGHDADLPTMLWIAARYLQSLSLLAAPFFLGRRLRYYPTFAFFALLTAGLVWSVFTPGFFPRCFIEGQGLTAFKIISEYVISLILLSATAILVKLRREFDPAVIRWLVLSLGLTVASELAFTAYISVYGAANLVGHLLRIVSVYFMYKAIVETGLVRPYDLLFRDLKRSEEALRRDNETMRALQGELAARNRDLKALNDLKNEFLGIAAHDLRTPPAVISLYSDLLLGRARAKLSEEEIEYLRRIHESAAFMLSLVDDLLDIAQIESGKLRLKPVAVDLDALLSKIVHLYRAPAEKKGLALVYQSEEVIPKILADPIRLEQAVNNLLGNAFKFSNPGGMVRVRLAMDGAAVITVSDQGQGIPPEELDMVFKPFARGTARPTAGEKSTGLGLAIARKVVEEHGGAIRVESRLNEGTIFTIRLPLPDGPAA